MATTENTFTQGSGDPNTRSFTFPYIKKSDVKVSVAGVDKTEGTGSDQWQWSNATTIQFNTTPATGSAIRIYRATDDSALSATFYAGSAIKSADLNDNFLQNLYTNQEVNNNVWKSDAETIDSTETWASNNTKIATTGAVDARVDSKIDTALTTDVAAGNKITVTDNSPGSGQITIAVTSGSLVNSDINASAAIAGTKISPDFGSQNIATTGTVDGRDVSADGIKLDNIDAGAKDDQTAAEIRVLVGNASDSNVFTDALKTKLDGVDSGAKDDQTAAEIRVLVEAATDSNVFTDADHTKVNAAATLTGAETLTNKTLTTPVINDMSGTAVVTSGTSTSDTKTYSAKRAGEIFYGKDTAEEIQSGETWSASDDKVATTSAIDARIIDLVDDVGGFVPIANETSFPNANPDVNNGAGTIVSIGSLASNLTSNGSGVITIANGTVGNSTVTITGAANSTTYSAGYGLLVETTSTLNTYTFHRLSSKATEVTTVASNISNVNTVAGNNTNINTVAGANSNITTVAGSISNVNTAAGSIANINTVATNISNVNDFSDKYRVASSAPTSSLDTGDLYFDTTANELKVYNGSAWQGGVTATGNFAAVTGNTFTGTNSHLDNIKSQYGTGNDLQIYHNSTGELSTISNSHANGLVVRSNVIALQNSTGDHDYLTTANELGVSLFYDNVKKFETSSTGTNTVGIHVDDGATHDGDVTFTGDSSNGLWDKSASAFVANLTGNVTGDLTGDVTGDVTGNCSGTAATVTGAAQSAITSVGTLTGLTVDGDLTFTGASANVLWDKSTDDLIFNDNAAAKFGTDSDGLNIYHDGSNSYIRDEGTGKLLIDTNGTTLQLRSTAGEEMVSCFPNAASELFYDNSKKLATTSGGVDVTGALTVNGAAIGGGLWEVLSTNDFSTTNASYSENTGWTTSYTMVKCVFGWIGTASGCNLSMRWYMAGEYGNNGTIMSYDTKYYYAKRTTTYGSSNRGTSNGNNDRWKFANGNGSSVWSGEVTFRIGQANPFTSGSGLSKWATAKVERTTDVSDETCYCSMDDTPNTKHLMIVGARLYEDGGNDFTKGRVTWYGLKYA